MAEPGIKRRAISLTLLCLSLVGAYYVADFKGAPAQSSKDAAAGEASQAKAGSETLLQHEDRSDLNFDVPVSDRADSFELERSIENFKPAELYAQYVEEANDGNLDAQYLLVTVLNECRHLPTTKGEITELERSGLAPDVIQAVKGRFQRCEPLFNQLTDLENQYEQKYRAVRDANYPLITVKRRKPPLDEKRKLVKEAISHDYPEPYLYAEAYVEAATLHREYPEKLNILREEAWLMLYCEASFHCDSKKEFEYMRTEKYHEHEIDEILKSYASIKTAIEQEEWDALGL